MSHVTIAAAAAAGPSLSVRAACTPLIRVVGSRRITPPSRPMTMTSSSVARSQAPRHSYSYTSAAADTTTTTRLRVLRSRSQSQSRRLRLLHPLLLPVRCYKGEEVQRGFASMASATSFYEFKAKDSRWFFSFPFCVSLTT